VADGQGRHQGGNKWIGTAGTSPFGAEGYNPEGIRIGQKIAWFLTVSIKSATQFAKFQPGAVAPFPLPRVERVFIDQRLLAHDRVWVGAGSEHHLAGLPPAELVRLSRAEPVDVSGGATG